MKPETFFHKIGTYLGMQDIDFEEYPKFSNQYLLKGEDEYLIRRSFSSNVLKFFSVEKKWYLEGLGYYLILYKKKKLLSAKEIGHMVHKGLYLFEEFKKNELPDLLTDR